jgi:hypothetical protein
MATNPTSKLQPTSKAEVDPAETAKAATTQAPAMLEDDDEFEDFPVEGTSVFRLTYHAHNVTIYPKRAEL